MCLYTCGTVYRVRHGTKVNLHFAKEVKGNGEYAHTVYVTLYLLLEHSKFDFNAIEGEGYMCI